MMADQISRSSLRQGALRQPGILLRRLLMPAAVMAAAFFALHAGNVLSQSSSTPDDYPSKPVTIVVPYEGGGVVETEFRLYMQSIRESTGKQFIMDLKAGAGTTIGTAYAAKAAPDGYTLLTVNSPFTIAPSLYPDLPYDNIRDFAPISLLTKHAFLFVVNASSPFKSIQDYVGSARARPDQMNYSTAGIGSASHLPGALLHFMANIRVTMVHYKNSNQRLLDLMAGRVDASAATFSLGMGSIRSGKMRAIAVTSRERVPVWPDMPTVAEQGVPDFDYSSWVGISAPARVPPAVISRLNGFFVKVLKDPVIIRKLEGDGTIMVGSTPEQFRQHILTETERWRRLIRETGIKLGD